MTLGQQLLFLISALGVFNGLIISGHLLLFKKGRRLHLPSSVY